MKLFRRGKRIEAPVTAAAQGTASGLFPAVNSYTPLVLCQNTLYKSLMEAVPIINAAVHKIIRLTGGFSVETGSDACDKALAEFCPTYRATRAKEAFIRFWILILSSS